MKIDGKKELTPVLYGDSAVRILHFTVSEKNKTCFGVHWHERMELCFVSSGSMKLRLEDEEFTVREGSVAIIPPEKNHTAASGDDGVEYYTVMFDISYFYNSSYASEKYLKPIANLKIEFVPITDDFEIADTVNSLVKEQLGGDEYSALTVIGKIYTLLGLLYRKCLLRIGAAQPVDNNFGAVFDYIAENYASDISSSLLSAEFGYSEPYFCRRFKAITGLTPVKYINIFRLEKAKAMLKKEKKKIAVIASECGFNSVAYFSKTYKRYFGITPKETRIN